MPVEQELIGDDEERTGTTGGIDHFELRGFRKGYGFLRLRCEELAEGVLDDVIHDVGGSIIDAARFADFWFFLDLRLVSICEANGLAEKSFVN
jgi:hypothetical protein